MTKVNREKSFQEKVLRAVISRIWGSVHNAQINLKFDSLRYYVEQGKLPLDFAYYVSTKYKVPMPLLNLEDYSLVNTSYTKTEYKKTIEGYLDWLDRTTILREPSIPDPKDFREASIAAAKRKIDGK